MADQKNTGRMIVVGSEVYVITCDKTLPRHYTVAATFLLAMIIPQMFRGPFDPLFYAAFVGLSTLGLAWLFDDRETYRLRHIMDLTMPKASDPSDE